MTNKLNVFIPRILANISATHLKNIFSDMKVGRVTYLDMRNRVNSNNYKYSFAFVTIDMYNTDIANKLRNKIKEYGHAQLPYDEYNYWELKSFVPREQRSPVTVVTETTAPVVEDDEKEPEWLNNGKEWTYPPSAAAAGPLADPLASPRLMTEEPADSTIKDLCDDLMHYKPWTYPSPAITAQNPAYYPSSFLRTTAPQQTTNYEFDLLMREIDKLRNGSDVKDIKEYRLF